VTDRPEMSTVSSTLSSTGFLVKGVPFTVLGAETHNSSTSTPESTRRAFRRVRELGANTVLAPVSWNLFEPVRGTYDFVQIDAMLEAARAEGLLLVPLWFGSWKNAMSTYVPDWVKLDTNEFPRAETIGHRRVEHLSPFGEAARQVDARAFGALMAHLREVDQVGTVILVQVENEVGLLGDSRDRSALAEEAWRRPVPDHVIAVVESSPQIPAHTAWQDQGSPLAGTWPEVFGESAVAEEAFMASAYSSYIEVVAATGRAEYGVPLYVNAWLDNAPVPSVDDKPAVAIAGGSSPGEYPSGGPVTRVAPIWRALAPTIDVLAPDIYFGDFATVCQLFTAASGHLFIPEMRRSELGAAQMLYALGEYHAMGVSPFGVDTILPDSSEEATLSDAYRLARAAVDLLNSNRSARSRGFLLTEDNPAMNFDFDELSVGVDTAGPYGQAIPIFPAYGILIEETPGVFVAIGRGFYISVSRKDAKTAGILAATEIDYDGAWRTLNELNGDETASGSGVTLYALAAPKSSTFPIPLVKTSTGIVRIRTYSF
jgi:Glycosyl hydrolases family 35/Domain of unknown function (DUF5597)